MPSIRHSELAQLLACIDQRIVKAKAMVDATGDNDTWQQAFAILVDIRNAIGEVEAELNGERR